MKQGMTLQELAHEVQRVKAEKRDFLGETTYLEARPKLDLVTVEGNPTGAAPQIINGALDLAIKGLGYTGDETFAINKVAHGQIANKIQIPAKYYNRMLADAPALLAHNINHWFREEPQPRLVRTLDGWVRAVLSNMYRCIENADLIDALLPPLMERLGPDGLRFESSALTDTKMYLKAFIPSLEIPIRSARVKDVIRVGFIVGNSEVGYGEIYAQPMVMVLSCLNGMQFNQFRQGIRHVGKRITSEERVTELYSDEAMRADDKAIILKTRDVALAALDEAKATQIAERIVDASNSDEITGDVPTAIKEVGDRMGGLTEHEQSGILNYLASGGDLSKWGVAQAVTRFSQDVEDYDRADELEQMGGDVIELPKAAWTTIATMKEAA